MGRLRLRKLTQVVSVHTNWKIRVPGFCSGWRPVNKSQVPQIPPGLAVEENIGVSKCLICSRTGVDRLPSRSRVKTLQWFFVYGDNHFGGFSPFFVHLCFWVWKPQRMTSGHLRPKDKWHHHPWALWNCWHLHWLLGGALHKECMEGRAKNHHLPLNFSIIELLRSPNLGVLC